MLTETIDGRKKYFYGSSDRECERKRDEYLEKLAADKDKALSVKHFGEVYWTKKEGKLSPNSIANYRTAYNRVIDCFGERKVTEVSAADIYEFLNRLAAKDLSTRVVGLPKTVLSQIMDIALIERVIDRNPCNDVPKVEAKAITPRQAAPEEDLKKIEKHKADSLIARMYYFMLYTGCRRAEATALQFKHIDRAGKVAHIVQSVAYGKATPTLKLPKSAAGVRDVELLDNVLAILPEGPAEQYVFWPDGLPKQKTLEKALSDYQKQLGLSSTAHQLRHSYASMLHSAGIDVKDAQVLLGHSDVSITQNIYTHIEKAHKQSIAERLNEHVKGKLSTELSKTEKDR